MKYKVIDKRTGTIVKSMDFPEMGTDITVHEQDIIKNCIYEGLISPHEAITAFARFSDYGFIVEEGYMDKGIFVRSANRHLLEMRKA